MTWHCDCGEENPSFMTYCRDCMRPYLGETLLERPRAAPATWTCSCGESNLEEFAVCMKCDAPRDPVHRMPARHADPSSCLECADVGAGKLCRYHAERFSKGLAEALPEVAEEEVEKRTAQLRHYFDAGPVLPEVADADLDQPTPLDVPWGGWRFGL